MTIAHAKPTPWEVAQAVETLRAIGCVFSIPSSVRFYSVTETASALRANPKFIKEHLDEFPGSMRLPGGQIRIPFNAIKDFALKHRNR